MKIALLCGVSALVGGFIGATYEGKEAFIFLFIAAFILIGLGYLIL